MAHQQQFQLINTMTHQGSAVIIGNFDGCHLGHQLLVSAAKEIAATKNLCRLALTFSPNPKVFLGFLTETNQLFTPNQKSRALRELGLDEIITKTFDTQLMNSSPRDFFDSTLIGQCNAAAIIVGDDFRFGHRQQGSVATLREFAQKTGTLITAVNGLTVDQHSVKSSLIRRLIEESGDVSTAERLLGRYYAIEGDIVKGNQLGRKIGVPTANLNPVRQLIPQKGVYAGYVYIADSDCLDQPLMKVPKAAYPAVLSIGFRPTVSKDTQLSIEAHILQSTHEIGLDSLYGKKAAYYFSHRLRNEMRFHSIEELQHEMGNDIARAKRLLGLT